MFPCVPLMLTLSLVGLVKLNYSPTWTVKDVWESGCWEPREDQLSWQEYELSSELARRRAEGEQESQLTEHLTTQIVGRKAPLITCRSVDRRLVTSMSRMPWTEQRMVKQRMDTNLLGKRAVKRASVGGEQTGSSVRQSNITSLLDLVQTGKSVKYMKQVEREALGREITKVSPLALQLHNGEMSGEWELEHSYMCTVCGVEYDDMMEILHHKWESHPNCLVAHVNVKDNVIKPPNLLFPQVCPTNFKLKTKPDSALTLQVGPSRVTEEESSPAGSASILCSKCQLEFEAGPEGREKFHLHLLDCGGVQEAIDTGKKKKKKKRGMGGGLKSTVRMLKKSESVGEGTDTGNFSPGLVALLEVQYFSLAEEQSQSPKKKVRPPPRVLQPVPLIPTHQRTTRYKETMKKEAKKQAAKEKRQKAQQTRQRRARLSEETKIVAAVLDKVLSDVERLRVKKRRSGRALASPGRATELRRVSGGGGGGGGGKTQHRRERTVTTYKEESSDSEKSSEESLKLKTPKKSSSRRTLESVPSQPPTPGLVVVKVKVSNDEDLYSVTDLAKSHVKSLQFDNDENSTGDLSTEDEEGSRTATLECPRILKRLQTTLVTKMLTPLSSEGSHSRSTHSQRYQHPLEVKISALSRMENGEDHTEIAADLNITVSTLGAWWIRRSDIKLKYENKFTGAGQEEPPSPGPKEKNIRNRSRSLGPAEGKITKVGSDQDFPEEHLVARKKRGSRLSADSGGGDGGKGASSGKNVYSLEFKLRVLERLRAGEEIPEVARSVRVRENTVSVWWLRRDRIQNRLNTDSKLRQRRPTVSASPVMTGRWLMPMEVKQTAIRRLEQGITQATVARDLDVSLSTVASWWRKKDNILRSVSDSSEHKPEEEEEEEEEEEDTPLATSIDDMGVSELEHLMSDTDPSEEKHTDNTVQSVETVETVETMEADETIIEPAEPAQSDSDYIEEKQTVETFETNNIIELVETLDTTVENLEAMEEVETMKIAVEIPEAIEAFETMNPVEEDQTFVLVSVESKECNEQSEAVSSPDEESNKEPEAQLEETDQEETIPDCESEDVPAEPNPLPEREEEPCLLSSLASTPRPQSGLGLILSNYWSSDEEL